jgi:hypothetical protein
MSEYIFKLKNDLILKDLKCYEKIKFIAGACLVFIKSNNFLDFRAYKISFFTDKIEN